MGHVAWSTTPRHTPSGHQRLATRLPRGSADGPTTTENREGSSLERGRGILGSDAALAYNYRRRNRTPGSSTRTRVEVDFTTGRGELAGGRGEFAGGRGEFAGGRGELAGGR
eukprot:2407947-Pyramimonas_sp.AAC.1